MISSVTNFLPDCAALVSMRANFASGSIDFLRAVFIYYPLFILLVACSLEFVFYQFSLQ